MDLILLQIYSEVFKIRGIFRLRNLQLESEGSAESREFEESEKSGESRESEESEESEVSKEFEESEKSEKSV